jgi:4-hydroxy-tetrahydrodipicolinate synthase
MPWPSQPEAFVRIWDVWQAGDQRQAAELHEREIAPLAKLATAGIRLGHTLHKELLRRRGVIRSSLVRAPSDALDEITRRELDAVCDRLGIGNAVA